MSFHEDKLSVTQVTVENTSGSDYDQGDLVYEQGYFGNVVSPDGIADGSTGVIDINSERIIQTTQIESTDTFAESTDGSPAIVYFDRDNAELRDTNAGDSFIPVGTLVNGGAKGSNSYIEFKPFAQVSGAEGQAESILKTATVELTADEIVGTDAGDLGHSAGAVLVAAEAGKVHEFVSAVLLYTFDTAAYTGGNDDLVVRQGTTAVSAAIADADLLGDTADDIAYVGALSAADIKLTANSTLNLKSTAFTQPGTAAGTLSVRVTYRTHTV